MISQQQHHFFANIKTSPLSEDFNNQLSPLNVNSDDLKILELSTYGPGSVESVRSSGTDQSVDNLSLIHISQFNPSSLTLKNLVSFPLKEHQDLNGDLTCAVCGDAASGIHYSVISCNGCKTFFRRTFISGRTFVCKANGQCLFDKNKRCSCRSCRWQKCVMVGMNAQAIQHTPSANLTLSIARKRFQRSLRNPASRLNIHSLQTQQDVILQCIDQVLHLDEKFDRLRCSSFINYDPKLSLNDLIHQSSTLADANKYPLVEKWPPRPKELMFIGDLSTLKELGIKFWFYMDLYLSVEYIKTLPIFHQLKTQDKYSLMFDTALKDVYLSNAYYSYTKRAEEVIYPDNTRPFMQRSSLFEVEKLIRRGVVPEMCDLKPDQIQFSLMRAICALNYTCTELSEEGQELVAKQCSKYTTALLNYLQNKHGVQIGTRRFSESTSFLAMICQKIKNNYDYYAFKRFILRIPVPSTLFHEIMTKTISIKSSE